MDKVQQERGKQLARSAAIRRAGALWIVPSQSHAGSYVVDVEAKPPTCTCPDWELRRATCKHVYAVLFKISGEVAAVEPPPTREKRPTYRQDWPRYNLAATHEKEDAARLLRGLCDGIRQERRPGPGRPRALLSDVVFSAVMKVYVGFSGRRAASDLRALETLGFLDAAPAYNTIFKYLEDPALTPILKALVEESAMPLRAVESDFAVDGSGFSTCNYERWFDHKYGRTRRANKWLKAHIMTGVRTNVVTAVEITDGEANDSPQFTKLVKSTATRFVVKEISADKAYSSKGNARTVEAIGAASYIPFKSNATGDGPELWQRLFHFYSLNRADFLAHYHKRSNVESTFWMVKSKFGGSLRSKTPTAQVNELLAKFVCHNLAVLVSSVYELGIQPKFWQRFDA